MSGDGWLMKNQALAQSHHCSIAIKHHEELMKSQDHCVWELNGGFVDEDLTKKPCTTLWEALNSKTANAVVVVLTVVEGLVLLTELLVDLRIVQDPLWVPVCGQIDPKNKSNSSEVAPTQEISPSLQIVSHICTYFSLTILSIFIIEMLLRIVSGKVQFFKQCMELFDAMVVFAAFSLALSFLTTPKDGRNVAIFVVILRLWRVKLIVHSVIHDTKRQMSHIINAYKRDKIQAEHKVELLILKVEDLEHEVAYLKEKLKKTDKEAAQRKKHLRVSSQLAEFPITPQIEKYNPLFHNPILSQRPPPEGRTESPPRDQDVERLERFAECTVKAILRTASNELISKDRWQQKRQSQRRRSAGASDDIHEASSSSSNIIGASSSPTELRQLTDTDGAEGLLSNNSAACFRVAQSSQEELDELSEIERIKKIRFDPTKEEKNIPVTAL